MIIRSLPHDEPRTRVIDGCWVGTPTQPPNELYIQVAKQVRTVPSRGCNAEKVLVLRSNQLKSKALEPQAVTSHAL